MRLMQCAPDFMNAFASQSTMMRGHFCVDCVPVHQYAATQPERKKKNQLCICLEGELDRERKSERENGEQGQEEI